MPNCTEKPWQENAYEDAERLRKEAEEMERRQEMERAKHEADLWEKSKKRWDDLRKNVKDNINKLGENELNHE